MQTKVSKFFSNSNYFYRYIEEDLDPEVVIDTEEAVQKIEEEADLDQAQDQIEVIVAEEETATETMIEKIGIEEIEIGIEMMTEIEKGIEDTVVTEKETILMKGIDQGQDREEALSRETQEKGVKEMERLTTIDLTAETQILRGITGLIDQKEGQIDPMKEMKEEKLMLKDLDRVQRDTLQEWSLISKMKALIKRTMSELLQK